MPELLFDRPFTRAWERTHRLLLRPFSPETWIVFGFAAFLSGLAGGLTVWNPGARVRWQLPGKRIVSWSALELLDSFWLFLGVGSMILGVALLLLFLWIGSRGSLILLDAVVQGRGAIVEPWKRLRGLADSLFLWRLGFYGAAVLVGLLLASPLLVFRGLASGSEWGPLSLAGMLATVSLALVLGSAFGFVWLLLDAFVVPIMYRDGLRAGEAWRRFLPLLRGRPLPFVGYAVLVVLAHVAVALAVLVLAVPTCCVLPALVALPYVGSVVLLPVTVLLRYFSLEFLAQFGESYRVLDP